MPEIVGSSLKDTDGREHDHFAQGTHIQVQEIKLKIYIYRKNRR